MQRYQDASECRKHGTVSRELWPSASITGKQRTTHAFRKARPWNERGMQHNAGDNRTSKALWDRTSVLSCCSRLTPGSSRRPLPASTNAESVPADSVRTAKSVVPMLLREALITTRRVSGRSAFSEVRRLLDCRARQAGKGEHGREHKHTRPKCSVSKRKAEYVHMVRKADATQSRKRTNRGRRPHGLFRKRRNPRTTSTCARLTQPPRPEIFVSALCDKLTTARLDSADKSSTWVYAAAVAFYDTFTQRAPQRRARG